MIFNRHVQNTPHPFNAGKQPRIWSDTSDPGTITIGSGDGVAAFSDKSGNGNTLTQNLIANQPETGLATIGGKNVFKYTEANHHFLGAGNILQDFDYTLFIIAEVDLVSGNTEPKLISLREDIPPFGALFTILFFQNGGVILRWAYGTTGTFAPAGSVSHNTPFLLTIRLVRNQAQGLIRVDRVTKTTGFTWSPADVSPDFLVGTLFRAPNLGDFQGLQGEMLIWPVAFNQYQIDFIENFLTVKWGF